METVKPRVPLLFLLLGAASLLYAQTGESSSRVTIVNGEFRFTQPISFPAAEGASHYEVELERLEGDTFVPEAMIETETNSIETSLRAGYYRYRITAFNRMDLPEGQSGWQDFEVRIAVMPVVESYQPVYGLYYELAGPSGSITVSGRDFVDETEFALVINQKGFDWSGVSLEQRRDTLRPVSAAVNGDGTQAVLTFRRGDMKRGHYDIFVRNPGGLWTTFGQVQVGFKNSTDWTLSLGYAPMIAAFDYENAYHLHWEYYYDTSSGGDRIARPVQYREQRLDFFNPLGHYLRLGWIPIKSRIGHFGLELHGYAVVDKRDQQDDFPNGLAYFFVTMKGGGLNLLYQKPLGTRWQHNARLGLGGAYEFHHGLGDSIDYTVPWVLSAGYSAQYFVWKSLYLEAGLDIRYALYSNHLMFFPSIGLGWQMGRWTDFAEVAEGAQRGEDYSVPVTAPPKNEFTLSLGWAPMIPLLGLDLYAQYTYSWYDWYGRYQETVEQGDQTIWPFNPNGWNLRFAYIPFRWGRNKLGVEWSFSILDYPMRAAMPDEFDYGISIMSYGQILGVLYQRVITESLQLDIRAGTGISNAYGVHSVEYGTWANNTGASVQYFFWRNAYVEAGIDVLYISGDNFRIAMKPGISIGWQFNRGSETGLRLPGTGLPRFKSP